MPGRYSLTVQVANPAVSPPSPLGHVAVVLNEPSGQTYAGFGPEHHGWPSSKGQFDVHPVQPGETLPHDYSNVLGENQYATYTIPISEERANAAHAEIQRIKGATPWYTGLNLRNPLSPEVCTTIANRIMQAAGLGDNLSVFPTRNFEVLSDIADTLAKDPKAKIASRSGLPIPDELRGIQRDYAYVGGGYDTPSERVDRVEPVKTDFAAPDDAAAFGDRFGNWTISSAGVTPRSPNQPIRSSQPGGAAEVAKPPVRYLRGRIAGNSGASAFDAGAPAVPFVPPNEIPLSNRQESFNDRFGSWVSSPPVSAPLGPYQPVPQPQTDSSTGSGSQNIRVLSSRLMSRDSAGNSVSAGNPNRPVQPPLPDRPVGILTGKPMPDHPFPPPIFGFPDNSETSGDSAEDWFDRWIKPLIHQ